MLSGKRVYASWQNFRKVCEYLSTKRHMALHRRTPTYGKHSLFPVLYSTFPSPISTTKHILSPLTEHIFYPASTPPTITNFIIKFLKRN